MDFLVSGCDGRVIPPSLVDFHDRMQAGARSYRHLNSPEYRRRLHREDVTVRALLTVAERCGREERAAFFSRPEDLSEPTEADRIAADHGFGPDRLIAMKGLARSRGVDLETVLRAALRGDLVSIVQQPPIEHRAEAGRD